MNLFIDGNTKLGPEVACFNIPAIKTCSPTPWCLKHCYAAHGYFGKFKSIRDAAEKRWKMSKRPDFVEKAVAELKRRDFKYVRIHVSGDFYSSAYVKKWIKIAKALPEVRFWATTKRMFENLSELASLPNVALSESLDSSKINPKHTGLKQLTATDDMTFTHLPKVKVTSCIVENCPRCGYRCWHKGWKGGYDMILWRTKWAPGSKKKKEALLERRQHEGSSKRLAASSV